MSDDGARVAAGRLRVMRLDEDGVPISGWVSITRPVCLSPLPAGEMECVETPIGPYPAGKLDFELTAKLFYGGRGYWDVVRAAGLEAEMRAYGKYLKRTHGHAPKRRYKHGRVGVKRR